MKLDRNITNPKRGKYALIKLREAYYTMDGETLMVNQSAVDFGNTHESDFFVIRLKDKFVPAALWAYREEILLEVDRILSDASIPQSERNQRALELQEYAAEIEGLVTASEQLEPGVIPT